MNVEKIYYQLMDETNTELLEEGECPEIVRVEGERQTEISFKTNLKEGQEYCLNLTVEDDARNTLLQEHSFLLHTVYPIPTPFSVYSR